LFDVSTAFINFWTAGKRRSSWRTSHLIVADADHQVISSVAWRHHPHPP